jgi:hypothetical protein
MIGGAVALHARDVNGWVLPVLDRKVDTKFRDADLDVDLETTLYKPLRDLIFEIAVERPAAQRTFRGGARSA